jgi:TonB family protein
MKICPKCAQSFADGFNYCPKDATELIKYDLRASIQDRHELQFLIEKEPFLSRLKRELVDAFSEMKHNPLKFIASLLRGERTTRRRQRMLTAGFATAVLVYSVIILFVLLGGIFKMRLPDRVIAGPPPDLSDKYVRLVIPPDLDQVENTKRTRSGERGGSFKTPRDPRGGGGTNDKVRASRGVPPLPASQQINLPDFEPPKKAIFVVPETIIADQVMQRLQRQIGERMGQLDIPSRGLGDGPGVGDGKGPGYGRGENGNTGGDNRRPGGGLGDGAGGPGNLKPKILYKEKAPYTEAARLNKIQGRVVLNILFGADGVIKDIRTVQGLPDGLTESAIQAAQRIRFQPAMENGRPVSVRVRVEFDFALY